MDGGKFGQGRAFDHAKFRDEEEIAVLAVFVNRNNGNDFFLFIEVEEVLGRHAFSNTSRIWDLISAETINFA